MEHKITLLELKVCVTEQELALLDVSLITTAVEARAPPHREYARFLWRAILQRQHVVQNLLRVEHLAIHQGVHRFLVHVMERALVRYV